MGYPAWKGTATLYLLLFVSCPICQTQWHYIDAIMGAMAFQITSLTIVYSTVKPKADRRKHQSSVSLASVRGIHRWSVNSPHKGAVTRKMFPFDDVIMIVKPLSLFPLDNTFWSCTSTHHLSWRHMTSYNLANAESDVIAERNKDIT